MSEGNYQEPLRHLTDDTQGGDAARDLQPPPYTIDVNNAALLRRGAEMLRNLVPSFRQGPVSEFVPSSVAKLLDAVSNALEEGREMPDDLVQGAVEVAHHVLRRGPDVIAGLKG